VQRIFAGLAVVALALMVTTLFIGLLTGDYNGLAYTYDAAARKLNEMKQDGVTAAEIQRVENGKQQMHRDFKEMQVLVTRHMFLGILSALVTLLVCSISVTYFVGTSRWFKEVVETYKLKPSFIDESQRIKRRSFRWSLLGALVMLAIIFLGGAAEPTLANVGHSAGYVAWHHLAAVGGLGVLLLSFYMQYASLVANGQLIEGVMSEVRRIRQERGLAVEPEPSHS